MKIWMPKKYCQVKILYLSLFLKPTRCPHCIVFPRAISGTTLPELLTVLMKFTIAEPSN